MERGALPVKHGPITPRLAAKEISYVNNYIQAGRVDWRRESCDPHKKKSSLAVVKWRYINYGCINHGGQSDRVRDGQRKKASCRVPWLIFPKQRPDCDSWQWRSLRQTPERVRAGVYAGLPCARNSDAFVAKLTHLWLCPYSRTDSTKQKKKYSKQNRGREIKGKLKTYCPRH